MLAWVAVTTQAAAVIVSAPNPPAEEPRPGAVHVVAPCHASADSEEVVVCGRSDTLPDQRIRTLDPRFGKPAGDGLLTLPIAGFGTLKGGGPKGSAGITLKLPF